MRCGGALRAPPGTDAGAMSQGEGRYECAMGCGIGTSTVRGWLGSMARERQSRIRGMRRACCVAALLAAAAATVSQASDRRYTVRGAPLVVDAAAGLLANGSGALSIVRHSEPAHGILSV